MKLHPNTPAERAKHMLAIGLAALLTATPAFAQSDTDAMRRLQEENAALRRQLAEMQGKSAPAPTAQPTTTTTTAVSTSSSAGTVQTTPSDPDTLVLSPFQVKQDKDYGYLKTNSATATRIGTEIQKVPLSISVVSEDFIKDLNYTDIQDVLRYTSSSSGDTRMGVLQPGNGFTPSGNLSLRGFPINSRLRNGLLRFNAYSLDNVDRVELIKGPAAIFFGQAFPGGVINYVTKKPEFRKIPTTITYSYGGNENRMGSQRATFDHNAVLSDKAALRVVGAWDNAKGDQNFEFQDGYSVTPTFTLVPFKSGKLRITLEAEVLKRQRNQDDNAWFYPQGWFDAYANPTAALITAAGVADAAAYRNRIFSSVGNWIADVRKAAGDNYIPLYTSLERGAYYTDKNGKRVHDEKFNSYGQGTYSDEENATFSVVTEASPFSWVDVRHSYTKDNSLYTENKSQAIPNADGITFNTLNGILKRDYAIDAFTHQLDLVFKANALKIDHKLLVGGLFRQTYSTFTGTNAANLTGTGQFPFFGNLPGSFDKPDEGYVSPIPTQFRSTSFAGNFAQQFVRSRTGQILTPVQIFSLYDPGVHPNPDIRRITEVSRGLVDHGQPQRKEWYVNWQGTALQDKLTAFLGYRHEKADGNGGQTVAANYPWYQVGPYALDYIPQPEWTAYGITEAFSRTVDRKGDAKMAGLSYEVVKNVNVYVSYSKTFLTNGPLTLGGDYDEPTIRQRATSLGLNPDTEVARLLAAGGRTAIKNEKGQNMEVGVKVSLNDNKIVGTFSLFRVQRENRALDDTQRSTDEVLNYTGPGKTGTFNRIVRWYSNDAQQQTEGAEFDGVWSPTRNYQATISGSWMWQAKTVFDPTLTAANLATPIVYGNRLPYAPEFRLSTFNKYTFTNNIFGEYGRGLSVGLGATYASEIIISNDQNYNASRGGLTAGNYVVFDGLISYPFEVFGYQMYTTLNLNNMLNKEYSEGGQNLSAGRTWKLSLGMKF